MPYERSQKQCLWCEFSYLFVHRPWDSERHVGHLHSQNCRLYGPRTYTANWVVVLHVGDATAPGNGWSARTGTVTVNGDEMSGSVDALPHNNADLPQYP